MKVFLDSIGCRLNLSEIEKLAAELRTAGHEIVGDESEADIAIVNSCAVTSSAGADSRKSIRRIAASNCKKIFVTGCYATIAPQLVKGLPAVEEVYSNDRKDQIVTDLNGRFSSGTKKSSVREPLPGKHHRTRAFIKVQDGCENHCTFCITRIARGKSKSQSEIEIFSDVEFALQGGVKEIVLTGVNLGSWGRDIGDGFSLPLLIHKIVKRYSPNRIRLSSLEPWDVDESYFPLFEYPSFCRHLHLPLQSGSDSVLKLMGRKIHKQEFLILIQKIRKNVPDIAITTDLMVGFPGETEINFLESVDFIKRIGFAGGHVFRYSPRPGIPALVLDGEVPEKEKRIRSKKMREIIADQENRYTAAFLEHQVSVLWESARKQTDGQYILGGLTGNYLKVESVSTKNLKNEISNVKLVSIHGGIIHGQIIK